MVDLAFEAPDPTTADPAVPVPDVPTSTTADTSQANATDGSSVNP